MTFIIALPAEVLDYLGNFLDKRTLLNVVLVCRLFHQHFTPRIWNDVVVNSGQKGVKVDSLRAHSQWVHSLHFNKVNGHFDSDYCSVFFPKLTVLTIECSSIFTFGESDTVVVEKQDTHWARLVRLNPTLQDITLHLGNRPAGQGPAQFLETIFTTLPRPRRFELKSFSLPEFVYDTQQVFWRAVSRFEEVEYSGYDQSRRGLYLDVDLSRLKRLTYLTLDGNDAQEHDLRVLRKCCGLTRLRWSRTFEDLPVDAFVVCLEQSTWPLLEDLALDRVTHTDEDFAAIIHHVPPLKHLRLRSTTFGPVCFGQLRVRHFYTLRTLRMEACRHFSSRMALDVLLHCPHLENFQAGHVSAEDLLATPQPWACHGLRYLEVSFDGYIDGLESSNWLVFEQLSRLTLLEEIDVRSRDDWGQIRFASLTGMLQWRLDIGLELLAPLRRLRSLRLDRKAQNISRRDVEWMLDHWPLFERIYGDLSKEWELEKELTKLVRERGIIREI
ncbi:hypothetical protein BKA57DRAFT_454416 [Linnemannia elongata]|nr:hypothetical protein BKA57DRAFT_454416 [Linnemannia elongata]